MRNLAHEEFLRWASSKGLGLNPKYPQSAVLDFQSESESRFWEVPVKPELRPYFLATLIDLFGDWQTCHVWRHLGHWPAPEAHDSDFIGHRVERQIFKGLGLP